MIRCREIGCERRGQCARYLAVIRLDEAVPDVCTPNPATCRVFVPREQPRLAMRSLAEADAANGAAPLPVLTVRTPAPPPDPPTVYVDSRERVVIERTRGSLERPERVRIRPEELAAVLEQIDVLIGRAGTMRADEGRGDAS